MARRNGSPAGWRDKRARILKASDICHICGQTGADGIDHVVPLAQGGTDDLSNLKPAHHNAEPKCNRRKGDRTHANIIRRSGALD